MGTTVVPFCTGTYQARVSDSANTRTLNLYPEAMPTPESKESPVLIGTPGISIFCGIQGASDSYVCRGMYTSSTDRVFAVYGAGLYEIFANGTIAHRIPMSALTTRVFMMDNGTTMLVVDGFNVIAFNLSTNTSSAVTVPGTTTIEWVGMLGKRMIVLDGSPDYRWSDINFPTTFNALSIDDADTFADTIIAAEVIRDELWIFGPRSYEVRRLTDDPNYPYKLVGGSAGEIGCGAKYSVTKIGDVAYWMGSSNAGNGIVYRSNGYAAERISNHAIEYQIGQLGNISDAIGWTYQEEGHVFYVLTFVQGDRTFVFDTTTGQWHERSSRDPLRNIHHKWAPIYATRTTWGIVLGSQVGPYVLKLDFNNFTEYYSSTYPTLPIVRIHQSPHYWKTMSSVSIDEFTLDIAAGVGLQSGQGSEPQVMMQISRDGGHTWGNEHWRSFGRIGQYAKRVAWRMLGRSRSFMIRLQISDPVRVHILGGRLVTSTLDSAR